MFGHHDVADDHEPVALAYLLENRKKTVAAARECEKREASIAGAGDKVQMTAAIEATQTAGHDKLIVSAASCPPLQKSQERGTHRFGMGKRSPEIRLCWATRLGHPSSGVVREMKLKDFMKGSQ